MAKNSREYIRIRIDTRVFVEVLAADGSSDGLLIKCDVVDVSYSGFRVIIDRELLVGAILSVCAELPSVSEPFYMAAEVKWCRPSEDGKDGWLAGFKLMNSSDTDIESWRSLLEHL